MRTNAFARGHLAWLYAFSVSCLAGCFGEPRLQPPRVDVKAAGAAVLSEFDSSGDGAVAGPELDHAPSLKNTQSLVDSDKDGKLTADEIAARLALYHQSQTAMMSLNAQVSLNGKPLADATVSLVPEKFMGDAFKTATGKTDSTGLCSFSMSEQEPGTHVGFFRIAVSKKNAAGEETVPARYNSQTQLGGIIAPDSPLIEEGSLMLKLSGK